jgi:hypothetical protein
MWTERRGPILSSMLRSSTSPRLLLVADRRQPSSDLGQVAVRRFRLARVQTRGQAAGGSGDQPSKRVAVVVAAIVAVLWALKTLVW